MVPNFLSRYVPRSNSSSYLQLFFPKPTINHKVNKSDYFVNTLSKVRNTFYYFIRRDWNNHGRRSRTRQEGWNNDHYRKIIQGFCWFCCHPRHYGKKCAYVATKSQKGNELFYDNDIYTNWVLYRLDLNQNKMNRRQTLLREARTVIIQDRSERSNLVSFQNSFNA